MKNYTLHPTLLFRTPLLPLDGVLKTILEAGDKKEQIAQLKRAYQDKALQEAC